ncbi:MAG TPA: GNAT family N-acetyltransferase [Alphaproteobacteria bacterium]|jgi:RimJ/RimL family protein N-acetyltransferase|nr:GNAT family N-acetyltransferase [Alphaproteobacteria bacterium]
MMVLESDRLRFRHLTLEDAPFILELVNEPSWLRFIGDRGVRSLEDSRLYIRNGPIAMYEAFGFGLYAIEQKVDKAPIGLCGLVKRDGLQDFDLGFALLPRFWGQGFAREAAAAVLVHAKGVCGLARLVAIATPDNERSIKLLEHLGFRFERRVELSPNNPGTWQLFARLL